VPTQPLSPEAAALHAVIEGNEEEAYRILGNFMQGELKSLSDDASRLAYVASRVMASRCDDRGPHVLGTGVPTCVRLHFHDGEHRAHESWGEVTW
jgi:hypothetical protein